MPRCSLLGIRLSSESCPPALRIRHRIAAGDHLQAIDSTPAARSRHFGPHPLYVGRATRTRIDRALPSALSSLHCATATVDRRRLSTRVTARVPFGRHRSSGTIEPAQSSRSDAPFLHQRSVIPQSRTPPALLGHEATLTQVASTGRGGRGCAAGRPCTSCRRPHETMRQRGQRAGLVAFKAASSAASLASTRRLR